MVDIRMLDTQIIIEWFNNNPESRRIDYNINGYDISCYRVGSQIRIDIKKT